jgi:hypothetical protein
VSTPEPSPICPRGSWVQSRFRLRPLSGQRPSARRSRISCSRQGSPALCDAAPKLQWTSVCEPYPRFWTNHNPPIFFAGTGTCALIFFASSKSSHDVSTLLQLSLADLTQSTLACPMSWIPPNPVPVLCEAQRTKAPPAPALAQGLQLRLFLGTKLPISSGDLESQLT